MRFLHIYTFEIISCVWDIFYIRFIKCVLKSNRDKLVHKTDLKVNPYKMLLFFSAHMGIR